MVKAKKIVLPVAVLASFVAIASLIISNPPEMQRAAPNLEAKLSVEVLDLEEANYTVKLQSYGTVRPRTESQLVAQVGGQIVEVNAQFRNGGFFEKGDLLARIDDRDYLAEVNIATAALISAKQTLAEEQARAAQALQDWQRLGNKADAPDLVLRKPQLKAAEAQVISAESSLEKARLNLERTRIIAPFAGRILTKQVDVGEVVSANSGLADIYAIDYVEIRLPIKNQDLKYIRLPERYRFASKPDEDPVQVVIQSSLIDGRSWEGQVVRTEGAIDGASRQLHVIAQIDDPYGLAAKGTQPLKIGEYVTAEIQGIRQESALVIPNRSIYQGSYVYLVYDGVLQRREIDIAWQNDHEAIVSSGLTVGDQLVLTPLGQVTSGVPVSIREHNASSGPEALVSKTMENEGNQTP